MKQLRHLALLLTTPLWLAVPAAHGQGDEVLATVNGQKITGKDLYQALKLRYGGDELENIIFERTIRQAAEDKRIVVTKEDVDKKFREEKDRINADATRITFDDYLRQQHMTPELYKQRIEVSLLLKKAVVGTVTVTDQEVGEYFARHPQQFQRPETRRATEVAVKGDDPDKAKARIKAKALIEDLHKQIVGGQLRLEDAAEKYHAVPEVAKARGDLGYYERSDLPFQKTLFELKNIGDLSEPFEFGEGLWHIIRLDDVRRARGADFNEVKDAIRAALLEQKIKMAGAAWYQAQREKTRIERFGEFRLEPAATGPGPGGGR
jgi:foldase protein PrsA